MKMEMTTLMCIFLMTELTGTAGKTKLVIKNKHINNDLNWVIRNCRHIEVNKYADFYSFVLRYNNYL